MEAKPRIPWFSPWDLLPLAALAMLALAWPLLVRGLPDPLPTHFDARGVANGWTALRHLPWFTFGLSLGPWLLLLLLGRACIGSDLDPAGRQAVAMAPLRACLALGMLGAGLSPIVLVRWPWMPQGAVVAAALALLFAGLAAGIVLMVHTARHLGMDLGDPRHHRLGGLFYINPDDPATVVPKTLGLGYTLNFARGEAWGILAILLLPATVILLLLVLLPQARR